MNTIPGNAQDIFIVVLNGKGFIKTNINRRLYDKTYREVGYEVGYGVDKKIIYTTDVSNVKPINSSELEEYVRMTTQTSEGYPCYSVRHGDHYFIRRIGDNGLYNEFDEKIGVWNEESQEPEFIEIDPEY